MRQIAGFARWPPRLLQPVEKYPPVGQAGQRIGKRQLLDLLFGLPPLGDVA